MDLELAARDARLEARDALDLVSGALYERRVDPALAARARAEVGRVTGFQSRIAGGKLEIHFGTEVRLEELVEALESL